eukprot:contig_9368_g2248
MQCHALHTVHSVAAGDIIIGGDGWTDRQRNSICNVMLFTPEPLYVETDMWPEQRHTADNAAAFFMKRIEALGKRSVCAFVSDTEPKMRAVWGRLQEEYPWMLMVPCAAHCFDLLFSYLCKYGALADAVAFCNHMTQYWRNHNLPKMILERCQRSEYDGKVIQIQRPAATRWKSQLLAASSLADTQDAMEKAVVDAAFKSQCLRTGTTEQRGAAEEAAKAVRADVFT